MNKKIFQVIKLKNKINEYPSSSIMNAANEMLLINFFKKYPFSSIFKVIMGILKHRNYKKYAIKKPRNITQIIQIDMWARKETLINIKGHSD